MIQLKNVAKNDYFLIYFVVFKIFFFIVFLLEKSKFEILNVALVRL